MSSTKHKLRLMGAFAVLAVLALAVGCRGFFVNPTLTAINISPANPQVKLGGTLPLSVYGTYSDGSTGVVTSGVSWSTDTPTVATFASPTSDVLQGLSLGTATVTANAQAVSNTAMATVYIVISSISISPTNASITQDGGTASFTVTGNGTTDITSGATLTAQLNGTVQTAINCVYDGAQFQVCTDNQAPQGTYKIIASYPGSTLSATANLTVPAP
ncbi:MAG TPA: Ig-like domain-containing protein [Candidatus Aquilonibacter sp.]|nr:Ig-like domain-containing protein [Candidatus Aquilonibacter sp.]